MFDIILILLNLLRVVLCYKIWFTLKHVLYTLEKIIYFAAFDWNALKMLFKATILVHHLSPLFPYWLLVWKMDSLMSMGSWNSLKWPYYCWSLPLCSSRFALYFWVLLCWVHKSLKGFILLLNCSLYHYVVFFFVS